MAFASGNSEPIMAEPDWPVAGGSIGDMLRCWTGGECPLGAPSAWPPLLKSTVQLVLASSTPMTVFWGEDCLMFYNDAYAAIAGPRHPANLGGSLFEHWPELAEFNREVVATVFAGQSLSYRDLAVTLQRKGEAEQAWLNVDYSPIFDEDGGVPGILAVVIETTALISAMAEREVAEQATRRREQELSQVQKISRVGWLEVDLRGGFRNRRSPEYLAIHGLPPDAAAESHQDWLARIHPEDREAAEGRFMQALADGTTEYQSEYRIIRPSDGAIRWISAIAQIERDVHGQPLRLIGAHLDVTERKEAETQQKLLTQELAHRVKNTMAMIQAIASQTLRNARSIEEAKTVLTARLDALARAHDLLVGGRTGSALVGAIAQSIVSIQGDPERFAISGPDVMLGPKAALALTLILHELTTNAVKYGALSNDTGCVSLMWRVDEIEGVKQFRLRWQEIGGPPVEAPSKRGFGSRLIERSFPAARGGTETAFLPTGVIFTLDAPFDALKEGSEQD